MLTRRVQLRPEGYSKGHNEGNRVLPLMIKSNFGFSPTLKLAVTRACY